MRTFYEILGIKRNASQEEILVAYRKRCLETHPDRGGNETDFLNVRKGYEILSNPQKRIEYDKWVKAKEDIEKKNDISLLKKRLEPWINSFLSQYCNDDFFKTLILTYFYGVDSIYNNINRGKLNKVLTAEIVKKILDIIREDNTYNLESVLSLDSICNDILLGRKDIKVSQKIEKEKKEKENPIKAVDRDINNKFSKIAAWFVLVIAVGFVYLLCHISSNEPEVKPRRYVEQKQPIEAKDVVDELKEEVTESNEIKWLYDKFKENGYNMGSFDEFERRLHTKEGADFYYNRGKKAGILDVDKKSFYKIVGYKEKAQVKPTVQNDIPNYKETIFKTGDCPYAAYYGYGGGQGQFDKNSLSKLSIQNYSSSEAVVLLENIYGEVIRNVYIKNNSEYTITNIPEGRYRMKVMYGNSWNSEKNNGIGYPKGGFMRNVSFSKSKDNDLFDYTFERDYDGISYPTYSVTLHKVVNGNMQTERISKDDFF